MKDALETALLRIGRTLPEGRRILADHLGISRQAIEFWKQVPPERVLEVERLSGISRYALRPDIFGPAPGGGRERPRKRASYQPAA